jgi:DNA primase
VLFRQIALDEIKEESVARVPEAEIDRLKREVPLVELVRSRGVKLSGSGDNLMGLCPFHDDREPW